MSVKMTFDIAATNSRGIARHILTPDRIGTIGASNTKAEEKKPHDFKAKNWKPEQLTTF